MEIQIGGETIKARNSIKYLGLHLDMKLNFKHYATEVSSKAGKVANKLARKMLNISAAKSKKRKLIANLVHSILLYGAPVWTDSINAGGIPKMSLVQRKIILKVVAACRTVSREAIGVITGFPTIDLMAKERK